MNLILSLIENTLSNGVQCTFYLHLSYFRANIINGLCFLSFLSEILKLLNSLCIFETMENTLKVPEIRATYQHVCIQIINKDNNASIVNENRSNLLRRI